MLWLPEVMRPRSGYSLQDQWLTSKTSWECTSMTSGFLDNSSQGDNGLGYIILQSSVTMTYVASSAGAPG